MGIAIETKRMDMFVDSIRYDVLICQSGLELDIKFSQYYYFFHESFLFFSKSRERDTMLSYAFKTVMTLIQNRTYRNQLLRELINLYRHTTTGDSATVSSPDWVQMVQCLIFLDDPNTVSLTLVQNDFVSLHNWFYF